MSKNLLKVKGEFQNGVFSIKELFATEKLVELNPWLEIGWNDLSKDGGQDCDATHPCLPPTTEWYEECLLGKCVRFPY